MQRSNSKLLWRVSNYVQELATPASSTVSGAVRTLSSVADTASEPSQGVKATLFRLLGSSVPLTSAELWEQAETEGVKSKRHMKLMLNDLRKRGWVATQPPPADAARRDKAYRYFLAKKAKPVVSESPTESPTL